MSKEVLLIRHAESEMNLTPHLICGRSNGTPISELGKEQAVALGYYLKSNDHMPSKVVSSPANRTLQTAEWSLSAMGLVDVKIETDCALQELDQGDWEGLPRDQIYTPEILDYVNGMNGAFRPPNGESPRDVARRMYVSLDSHVASLEENGSLHVYTHGFAIRSLVGHLDGWSHHKVVQSITENTSVTRLEYDKSFIVTDFARVPEL
jgi:broad specificity phosphatase PhoE